MLNPGKYEQNYKTSPKRGVAYVTRPIKYLAFPRLLNFSILSAISPKHLKLDSSYLVHSFSLTTPPRVAYNITERGRGLGHITPVKFGIPSTISPKTVKLETSYLVYSFVMAILPRMAYNITGRRVA